MDKEEYVPSNDRFVCTKGLVRFFPIGSDILEVTVLLQKISDMKP